MLEGDVHNKPYVVEYGGEVLIIYLGVIDFLQSWTSGKKVAHVIKYLARANRSPPCTRRRTPNSSSTFSNSNSNPWDSNTRMILASSERARPRRRARAARAHPSSTDLKNAAGVAVLTTEED